MKAWLVKVDGTIEEIEVSGTDHTLIEVSAKYFNNEFLTLTRVLRDRLPAGIKDQVKDGVTHFSVCDNGFALNMKLNSKMTYAYGTGDPIVGLAVVYEKQLD